MRSPTELCSREGGGPPALSVLTTRRPADLPTGYPRLGAQAAGRRDGTPSGRFLLGHVVTTRKVGQLRQVVTVVGAHTLPRSSPGTGPAAPAQPNHRDKLPASPAPLGPPPLGLSCSCFSPRHFTARSPLLDSLVRPCVPARRAQTLRAGVVCSAGTCRAARRIQVCIPDRLGAA